MKLFKKTLAMVLAMAMLSSAAVFPAFATEEDPADVPGVEDVVEEPIAEEPDAEEPVVEEPTVESPADQEWDTWDFGSSTFDISGPTKVEVGKTITLTCSSWHTHSWSTNTNGINASQRGEVSLQENGNTVVVTGVKEGTVNVVCGWTGYYSSTITVTKAAEPQLVVTAKVGSGSEQTVEANTDGKYIVNAGSLEAGKTLQLQAGATYGSSTYAVKSWSSNSASATVDTNGKVTAVAAGSVKITAVLENETEVEFSLTITEVQSVPTLDSTYVYYYILKSDAAENQTKDENWSPFGIASVSNLATPTRGASSYPDSAGGNEVLTSLKPASFFPAEGTDYENHYAKSLVKEPYPTYIKDGKTYIWVNDPNRDLNDTDKDGNALYAGTFEIIWFRVKAENGAGCNRNTTKGDVRTCTDAWVESDVRTWHVDGKAVTNDKVTVRFMVKKPGAKDYVLYSDALPMTYTEDTLLSTISAPSEGTTLVNGVTCDLSDWYMDADLNQLKSANGSKTLGEYDTDNDGIIEIYAEYIPYTVTYQYKGASSDPDAVVDKVYLCNTSVNVPLPYGPEGEAEGEYFAGWSYYGGVAYGNAESVAWHADTTGSRNMTLTAVYYTENVNTNYVITSDDSAFTEQSKVSGVDAGRSTEALATPLFGAPEIRTIDGQKYVIAKFNADFTAVTPQPDDGNDDDTGTVIAENGEYNYVGFALAAAGDEVATSPTVQGGYSFTRSNDVFQSIGSESLGGGFYIVIKLGTGVDYATPYVIDTNGVYYYGTALEIQ